MGNKDKRELKESLQKLVHDGNDMDKKMRELYGIFKSIKGDIDTLVLRYMCRQRKSD